MEVDFSRLYRDRYGEWFLPTTYLAAQRKEDVAGCGTGSDRKVRGQNGPRPGCALARVA